MTGIQKQITRKKFFFWKTKKMSQAGNSESAICVKIQLTSSCSSTDSEMLFSAFSRFFFSFFSISTSIPSWLEGGQPSAMISIREVVFYITISSWFWTILSWFWTILSLFWIENSDPETYPRGTFLICHNIHREF